MHDLPALFTRLDLQSATIANAASVERRLSSLRGAFADPAAFAATLAVGDPIVYTVAAVVPGSGEGDLHYGLGMLMPGRVGNEYYLTKGHLHAWRPASEVYIGLTGEGMMLLEDEATGRFEQPGDGAKERFDGDHVHQRHVADGRVEAALP